MAGVCESAGADLGLVQGTLASVDCNVRLMVETGYSSLTRPGSAISGALVILLTIYVAVIGLRLMLGRAPLRVGELTMTAMKIGAIVALSTNWATYQHLVFDTLVDGPGQLGAGILGGLQGSAGQGMRDPFDGLQAAYDSLQRGADYFSQHGLPTQSPLQGGTGFAALALNASALLMILTTLGTLLAAKLVLALLLGLGPIFLACLLFDQTRGLFEGWLRAAVGFAFTPLLAVLSLVVQLTLLQPQLDRLDALPGLKLIDLGPPNAIFLIVLIFAGVTVALLIAVGIVAVGFRLPNPSAASERTVAAAREPGAAQVSPAAQPAATLQPPPRATQIARAAAAMERRDDRGGGGAYETERRLVVVPAGRADRLETLRPLSGERSHRRSAQPRAAASSQRRDR